MKTVCLLLTSQDKDWAGTVADSLSSDEITFVAPTFEGAMVARELGLTCQTFEEIAWGISKTGVHENARRMAREWFALDGLKDNPNLNALNAFDGYPLVLMHHTLMVISMMEVLEAWKYINQIIDISRPEKIVCGTRSHPLSADKDRLYAVAGSRGLEMEAARIIAAKAGIEFVQISPSNHLQRLSSRTWLIRKLKGGLRRIFRILRRLTRGALLAIAARASSFSQARRCAGTRRVLANCYGGYYLDQIKDSLMQVAGAGVDVVVNVIGGDVAKEQREEFSRNGIQVVNKSDISLPITTRIKANLTLLRLRKVAKRAMADIEDSVELAKYFSDESGSFYPLALTAIRRELVDGVPNTAACLVRSEAVIKHLSPDMVVSQFDFHPFEASDVLPARKLRIPTLGMDHGLGGVINATRHAFASEYVAVIGNSYAEAMKNIYRSSSQNIIPVGNLRFDMMGPRKTQYESRAAFGLDPNRPVCIFCDNSGWRMTNEWRNSELRHATEILRLKQSRPELQLIYRVHHGSDFMALRQYIESFNLDDVHFQVSPNPQFAEIVHAADLVITHFSSSIAEALVCGVPVIYLCALSEVEPTCLGYEAIKVVRDFNQLGEAVDSLIQKSMPREDLRGIAKDYLDSNLCGNDGLSSHRLAQKIIELTHLPSLSRTQGFEDWMCRVDESSFTRMADLLQ